MDQSTSKAIQVSKCIPVIEPTASTGPSLIAPFSLRRVHLHVCRLSERCAVVSVDACTCPEEATSERAHASVQLPASTTASGPLCNLALALTRPPAASSAAGALPPSLHTCIYESAESARTLEGSVSERMAASVLRALAHPTPLQLFFSLNVPLSATSTSAIISDTGATANVTHSPQASLELAVVRCLRDILS